jgi:hypothetical protein
MDGTKTYSPVPRREETAFMASREYSTIKIEDIYLEILHTGKENDNFLPI